METRMELFARIRRDARIEECSIRQLARRHQVGRATVRMALAQAEPPPRKIPVRCSPKLDPFKAAIDAMLTTDIDAPRKQRHTARRILARLADEHGAQHLSYSPVRDYVRARRAQIDVEAGRRIEVFVPQEHAPGAEAEVDFGEVWVILATEQGPHIVELPSDPRPPIDLSPASASSCQEIVHTQQFFDQRPSRMQHPYLETCQIRILGNRHTRRREFTSKQTGHRHHLRRCRSPGLHELEHDAGRIRDPHRLQLLSERNFDIDLAPKTVVGALGPFLSTGTVLRFERDRTGNCAGSSLTHPLQRSFRRPLITVSAGDQQVEILGKPLHKTHLLQTGATLENQVIAGVRNNSSQCLAHPVILGGRQLRNVQLRCCRRYGLRKNRLILAPPQHDRA